MRKLLAALSLLGLLAAAAQAAAPGPGPGRAAPGASASTASSSGNVRVERAADTVILTDGTKLTGTIIAAGLRAVVMIETDQTAERVIPRAEVESFAYAGKGSGEVKGYATDVQGDEGLPTIVGEGSAAPAEGGAPAPGPAPAAKPPGGGKPKSGNAPGPKAAPKPAPAAAPKAGNDLSKLWGLLGGNATAGEIKQAIAANPQWRAELPKILGGQVPADGADAVARFKARAPQDPELRRLLFDLMGRQGRSSGNTGGGRPAH